MGTRSSFTPVRGGKPPFTPTPKQAIVSSHRKTTMHVTETEEYQKTEPIEVYSNRDGQNLYKISKTSFTFSAGERQVRLHDTPTSSTDIIVDADIHSGESFAELLLTLSAIKDLPVLRSLQLDIPYFPYSRQDRQCAEGEAFSLRTFVKALAPYLDGVGDRVYTWDVHSHVANELIRTEIGCEFNNLQPQLFLQKFKDRGQEFSAKTIVIAPDKGAVERATLVQQALGLHSVVYATKVRNPKDGQILRTEVPEDVSYKGKNLLIVDDICDGGRTFIELAKVLRQFDPSRIDLYVTHGIFSKGFKVFGGLIDNFHVANLLPYKNFYQELPSSLTYLRTENYPTPRNQP